MLIERLDVVERRHIESALILCEGNIDRAAERLGIGRSTLYRKTARWRREDAITEGD